MNVGLGRQERLWNNACVRRGGSFALVTLLIVLGGSLVRTVPTASAAFTRPFVRQIDGTPTGVGGSLVPFHEPGGVAISGGSHLWVGDQNEGLLQLNEFDVNGTFEKVLTIEGENPPPQGVTPPQSLSIEDTTGAFFVTGNLTVDGFRPRVEMFSNSGGYVRRWGPLGSNAHITVDNSLEALDPSKGAVYVSSGQTTNSISKFNINGETANFSGSASYIQGNQITGVPSESFGEVSPSGIATNALGDIYVANNGRSEIDEYAPSGLFIQAFTGREVPGLGSSRENGGFGGEMGGVAIDPVSSHILITVRNFFSNEGAVDEFGPDGTFIEQIRETSAGEHLDSAFELAVDAEGDVYVVDSGSNQTDKHSVVVYGPGHYFPSLRLGDTTERAETSVTLNGSVNPENLALSDCHFEYVSEAAFQSEGFANLASGGQVTCAPSAGSIPTDSTYHDVTAHVTGLTSGVTYRYRLVATTVGSLGGTGKSEVAAFTARHAPSIGSVSSANVSSMFADLSAGITPLGADTTYWFEYVPSSGYRPENENPYAEGLRAPVTAADIGEGGSAGDAQANVLQQIGDLTPDTTYHFRVIAVNIAGETKSLDQTFKTLEQVQPGLPNKRVYELVTPPNKGGASDMFGTQEAFFNSDVGYSSESGDAFLLDQSRAAFGPFPASDHNAYVFKRDSENWTFTSLASPVLGVQSITGVSFDPSDFSKVAFDDFVGSKSSSGGSQLTNLAGSPGAYVSLHADPPAHGEQEESGTEVVGTSRDVSNVILESKDHSIAAGDESQDPNTTALFEWRSGDMTLLNINSSGELLSKCGAVLGQGHVPGSRLGADSANGERVIFTAPDPYAVNQGLGCWDGSSVNTPQIYARSNGATLQLSTAEPGWTPEGAISPAAYVGASADGKRAFFVTSTELTKNDSKIHDPELYEYNFETSQITRISAGSSGKVAANVLTVPAVSADGKAIYFTAIGRLVSGAPSVGPEQANLYRYATDTQTTTYVATVNRADYARGSAVQWIGEIALVPSANWYTTPNGRYLLFATARELAGFSTVEASPGDCPFENFGEGSGLVGHCAEVYRYSVEAAEHNEPALICVSCDPSGELPTSNSEFASRSASTGPADPPIRAMSDDGSEVFFDTADALVPQDGNGTLDVYEWHEGKIALISSGQDSAPSFFLGSSSDGANVFFGTHARLVRQDTDTSGDIYDARRNGGFPLAVSDAGACEGDACQVSPVAPVDPTPVSMAFSGAGDFVIGGTHSKPPSRKQLLAKAILLCKKRHGHRRAVCESHARKRYGNKVNTVAKQTHSDVRKRGA